MIAFTVVVDVTIQEIVAGGINLKKKVIEQDAINEKHLEEIRKRLNHITKHDNQVMKAFDDLKTIPEKYLFEELELYYANVNRDAYIGPRYCDTPNLLPLEIDFLFDDDLFVKDIKDKTNKKDL